LHRAPCRKRSRTNSRLDLLDFPEQRGTVIASPSTPESEWFARVLTAPLKAAGWEMEILPGTPTATMLQPTGVIIRWPLDPERDNINDQGDGPEAATMLADALNELGIDATALPGFIQHPHTIAHHHKREVGAGLSKPP
jgi:hypothetical protein